MTSTFDLISADFDKELRTIRRLLQRAYMPGPSGVADADVRIAASNASMLLVAASFEEFVRESVKEYVGWVTSQVSKFEDLPSELPSAVWERSLHILGGAKFGARNFDRSAAVLAMKNLQYFCLLEDPTIPVAEIVSYNRNNMRSTEVNAMMKRLGITDYCGVIGRNPRFVAFFGAPSPDKAHAEFLSHWDGFYETRNEIAHSIGSLKVTGVTDIERHLDFFLEVAAAVAEDLNARAV